MLGASVGARRDIRLSGRRYFALGCVLGGICTAVLVSVLAGVFSWMPGQWGLVSIAVGSTVLFGKELGLYAVSLPQCKRQIPRELFLRGARKAGFQFGFELGTGVRTYLSSVAPYILVISLLVLKLPALTIIGCGACFGLGRAILMWRWPLATTPRSDAWIRLLNRRPGFLRPVSAIVCAASAIVVGVERLS